MIEQPPGRRGPSSRPIIRTREYCTEREIPARSTREYNIIPHGENKRESCTERTIRYGRRRIMLENLSCICTSADSAVFYSDIEYRISTRSAFHWRPRAHTNRPKAKGTRFGTAIAYCPNPVNRITRAHRRLDRISNIDTYADSESQLTNTTPRSWLLPSRSLNCSRHEPN